MTALSRGEEPGIGEKVPHPGCLSEAPGIVSMTQLAQCHLDSFTQT